MNHMKNLLVPLAALLIAKFVFKADAPIEAWVLMYPMWVGVGYVADGLGIK
jgi:hypothetical protein